MYLFEFCDFSTHFVNDNYKYDIYASGLNF